MENELQHKHNDDRSHQNVRINKMAMGVLACHLPLPTRTLKGTGSESSTVESSSLSSETSFLKKSKLDRR